MSEWARKVKLGALCKRVGGGTPTRDKPEYWGGDIPWFTVADFTDSLSVQRAHSSREGITELGLQHSAGKLVEVGSVICSTRVVVGKVAIAEKQLVTNQDFASLICPETLNNEFLAYFLLDKRDHLRAQQSGATIQGIRLEVLETLELPLPTISEQRRIVARIQDCFSRLEEMEQLQKKGLTQAEALISRAIDQIWAESDVASAPLSPLSQVANVTTGNTPTRKVPAYFSDDGVPWITPGDMNSAKLISSVRERLSTLGVTEGRARVVPANSIIVCCIGATIGKVAMVEEATGLNQQLNAVTFGKDVLPDYGYWACRALFPQIISNAAQSTLPILSKRKFEELEIPVPPKAVQKRISETLDRVQIASLEMAFEAKEVLRSYQHLRTAILREAFAGLL